MSRRSKTLGFRFLDMLFKKVHISIFSLLLFFGISVLLAFSYSLALFFSFLFSADDSFSVPMWVCVSVCVYVFPFRVFLFHANRASSVPFSCATCHAHVCSLSSSSSRQCVSGFFLSRQPHSEWFVWLWFAIFKLFSRFQFKLISVVLS